MGKALRNVISELMPADPHPTDGGRGTKHVHKPRGNIPGIVGSRLKSARNYRKIPEGLVEGYAGPGRFVGNADGTPKKVNHGVLPAKPDPKRQRSGSLELTV